MILKVKDLLCGYEDFLLKDLNFSLKRGEFLGIIGPNGSGKTTLVRALSRVIKPLKGEVLLEDENVWNIPLKEFAKKVAVVSQNARASSFKIKDYVLLGRIPHYRRFQFLETERDLMAAEKAMSLTGILHLKDRSLKEVSGGERQLAVIARALAQEPELLLLDEPVAHLDIAHQVMVLNLVKKLKDEFGLTVVVVLHELNLASEFCDRLLIMNEGRIRKIGSPDVVLTEEILKEIYKTDVLVRRHPISSRPHVILKISD